MLGTNALAKYEDCGYMPLSERFLRAIFRFACSTANTGYLSMFHRLVVGAAHWKSRQWLARERDAKHQLDPRGKSG